jgi:Flp pilus assembly protein TadG
MPRKTYLRSPRTRRRLGFRLRAQDGSSLIEFALVVALILTPLLLGMLEFGRVFFAKIEVTDAARAGVAYGSRNLVSAADLAGSQTAALNDAPDNISGTMTATAAMICECSDGTVMKCANAASTCSTPKHSMDYVQVNTQATIDPLFHVPGLPTKYTVTGHAIVRVQ